MGVVLFYFVVFMGERIMRMVSCIYKVFNNKKAYFIKEE
jgi:hypothetical protein